MKEPQENFHSAKLAGADAPPSNLSMATKLVGVLFALAVGIVLTVALSGPWFIVGVLTHAENMYDDAPIWWITAHICLALLMPVAGVMAARRFYRWYIARKKAELGIE